MIEVINEVYNNADYLCLSKDLSSQTSLALMKNPQIKTIIYFNDSEKDRCVIRSKITLTKSKTNLHKSIIMDNFVDVDLTGMLGGTLVIDYMHLKKDEDVDMSYFENSMLIVCLLLKGLHAPEEWPEWELLGTEPYLKTGVFHILKNKNLSLKKVKDNMNGLKQIESSKVYDIFRLDSDNSEAEGIACKEHLTEQTPRKTPSRKTPVKAEDAEEDATTKVSTPKPPSKKTPVKDEVEEDATTRSTTPKKTPSRKTPVKSEDEDAEDAHIRSTTPKKTPIRKTPVKTEVAEDEVPTRSTTPKKTPSRKTPVKAEDEDALPTRARTPKPSSKKIDIEETPVRIASKQKLKSYVDAPTYPPESEYNHDNDLDVDPMPLSFDKSNDGDNGLGNIVRLSTPVKVQDSRPIYVEPLTKPTYIDIDGPLPDSEDIPKSSKFGEAPQLIKKEPFGKVVLNTTEPINSFIEVNKGEFQDIKVSDRFSFVQKIDTTKSRFDISSLFTENFKKICASLPTPQKVFNMTEPAYFQGFEEYIRVLLSTCVKKQEMIDSMVSRTNGNFEIWVKAFTNISFDVVDNYEVLEFIGDRALSSTFGNTLLKKFPNITNQLLTESKSQLLDKKSLSVLSIALKTVEWVRFKGISPKRFPISIAEDTFEAICGAIMMTGNTCSNVKDLLGYYYLSKFTDFAFDGICIDNSMATGTVMTTLIQRGEMAGATQQKIEKGMGGFIELTENIEIGGKPMVTTKISIDPIAKQIFRSNGFNIGNEKYIGEATAKTKKSAESMAWEKATEFMETKYDFTFKTVKIVNSKNKLLKYDTELAEKCLKKAKKAGFDLIYFKHPSNGQTAVSSMTLMYGLREDDISTDNLVEGKVGTLLAVGSNYLNDKAPLADIQALKNYAEGIAP